MKADQRMWGDPCRAVSKLQKKIRDKRKKLKLTQKKLAELSGVSETYISFQENGLYTHDIGFSAKDRLEKVLGKL